jgi:hypothetical protein
MNERIIKFFNRELSKDERIVLLKEAETDEKLRKVSVACQNVHSLLTFVPACMDSKAGDCAYADLMKRRIRKHLKPYAQMATSNATLISALSIGT